MGKFLVFVALLASVLAEPEPQPKADPWLLYGGYYGHLGYYGYPYAHYGYYGKRSAEPEPTAAAEPNADAKADPWLLYGYGYGYPYYGYGYAHYGYPYAGYYYGKRSADAEPEPTAAADPNADPKADPYLLYGGYYGHLGYYGY